MVGVRRRTGPLLKNCSSASESPGEMDRIFVADGPVWTSARGWHRFGARLIEHDMGQDTARANARTMVVYHRRAVVNHSIRQCWSSTLNPIVYKWRLPTQDRTFTNRIKRRFS